MINSPLAKAKPILDAAYQQVRLPPAHGIGHERVKAENAELGLYDYIFSSNDEVDAALLDLGIPECRILKTSFGWTRSRFASAPVERAPGDGLRFVFVGSIDVRKGAPNLVEAWTKAAVDGQLLFAGSVEAGLRPIMESAFAKSDITHLGHVADVAELYRACDVFVFPTHEEGGPQVTYEAAACGLPVITTPMGAARLIEDGVTGLIAPAGDVDALAISMQCLASEPDLRARLAANAHSAVDRFEYENVGHNRAALLARVVSRYAAASSRND
ncbi:MAG: glycosyltransferase [Erythrobacter sp.]|uniref:glycosyltransferase n=1 Tax=Erythrobacter sp. TaxID=1042 RepID=UPI00260E6FCD|nr:glycosyltransferase [Erythrobacter sp.]MDJ0979377.1 glycosyltransferase [Erythrobacter sp.]